MSLLTLNDKPIVLKGSGGGGGSSAGYKVTFPATVTNWDKVNQFDELGQGKSIWLYFCGWDHTASVFV